MAVKDFRTFKLSDNDIITAFQNIASDVGEESANLTIWIAKDHSKTIQVPLSDAFSNETINELAKSNTSLAWQLQASYSSISNASIRITREPGSDAARLNINNEINHLQAIRFISSCEKNVQAYERTEQLDQLLGDELAEFYRKREEGLLRLEALSQKLIENNESYRTQLDEELATEKRDHERELRQKELKQEKKIEQQKKELDEKIALIKKRESELDDRDSKHARRQIRADLKSALAKRAEEFTLTEKTNNKRKPIHVLFIILMSVFGFSFIQGIYTTLTTTESLVYLDIVRLGLSAIGFTGVSVFYIRWNDSWFRQHADEEFALKRLELDIDRASWVVEMAMEWQEEKGSELPDELIDRLTQNLFTNEKNMKDAKHPSEDLATALLSATNGLSLTIPGLGQIALDRKGLKQFQKRSEKSPEQR